METINNSPKNLLRQEAKLAVKSFDFKKVSPLIVEILASSKPFLDAQSILFYWPMKHEVDLKTLLELALQEGKKCYLPKTLAQGHDFIPALALVHSLEQRLIKGHLGNFEP
ncbi:MAG: 5-formyltetrahydrofolate cyclo-ligase, partial [Candidatus Caenarcaniphilales bacterium]|nr:5-formyltetrahydrofolate cyclo-ligase [Candidatus Caenarcaniphilales bacterium]